MAVPTKEYPRAAPAEVEKMRRLQFEWTQDGLMCQIHVLTSRGRSVTLNPGLVGTPEFTNLWDAAVPGDEALAAIFNAVPDLTDEERGVVVAAPE